MTGVGEKWWCAYIRMRSRTTTSCTRCSWRDAPTAMYVKYVALWDKPHGYPRWWVMPLRSKSLMTSWKLAPIRYLRAEGCVMNAAGDSPYIQFMADGVYYNDGVAERHIFLRNGIIANHKNREPTTCSRVSGIAIRTWWSIVSFLGLHLPLQRYLVLSSRWSANYRLIPAFQFSVMNA